MPRLFAVILVFWALPVFAQVPGGDFSLDVPVRDLNRDIPHANTHDDTIDVEAIIRAFGSDDVEGRNAQPEARLNFPAFLAARRDEMGPAWKDVERLSALGAKFNAGAVQSCDGPGALFSCGVPPVTGCVPQPCRDDVTPSLSSTVPIVVAAVSSATPSSAPPPTKISMQDRYSPGSFMSAVAVRDAGRRLFCSGVLVDSRTVLSAAHCFCGAATPADIVIGHDAHAHVDGPHIPYAVNSDVTFYDQNFCTAYAQWRRDKANVPHPSGDLALVHLVEDLDPDLWDQLLPPQPIARGQDHSFLTAVGFGESIQQAMPGRKSVAQLKFTPRLCDLDTEMEVGCRAGMEFIAVGRNEGDGHDTCFGDSGGPLFLHKQAFNAPVPQGGFDHPPLLVGITSRGLPSNRPGLCSEGSINVSLEYPPFADWIENFRRGRQQ